MSFNSSPQLLCYWLQIHIPTLIMRPLPALATRFSSYHIRRPSLSRKDARTLAAFYQMFEAVSKHDVRASPGRTLTLRDTWTIPAGTTFGFEDRRIMQLLEQETVSMDEQAEVIGTMSFDGIEDKFTFFEVSLLPGDFIGEWKRAMSGDLATGSQMLLASLYQGRYPYEDPERIAHSGSCTVPADPRSGTEE
jgi:hypothetical protein